MGLRALATSSARAAPVLAVQECLDTVEEDDGRGRQKLFRIVRIPFRVLCVSGNLKMRLRVEQDCRTRTVRLSGLRCLGRIP